MMNSEPDQPIPPCEEDEHDWEFVDDSFDHEFGTERIFYYRCAKCSEMKDVDGYQYDFDDYPEGE